MNINKGIYFVSGIDTDAGKSFVTGIIAKRLIEKGITTITQKFIQTGGENIDIPIHRKIMGMPMTEYDKNMTTCPVMFSYPCSVHLASKLDNKEIDYSAIEKSIKTLSKQYDIVLLEGAGGLCVPLNGLYTTIDYIKENKLPVIFVTSGKLGSINHTILSLEACRARNIEVPIIAYNHHFDTDKIISKDTLEYIKTYTTHYHPNSEVIEIESI